MKKLKRAFFEKGPIIGTFGGPFISDMINLGSLAGIQGFEEDDFLSYLLPMQDDLDPGSMEWKRKLLSTLNTQVQEQYIVHILNGEKVLILEY